MKIPLNQLKVGDYVYCDGFSGFCTPGIERVRKLTKKYDSDTGEPYNVIWVDGNRIFHGIYGAALSPPFAYHISPIDQSEGKREYESFKKSVYGENWKDPMD